METGHFIAFGVLIVVIFCSSMVGRKVYLLIKKKSNGWAITAGIVSFIAFFSLVAIAILYIILSNADFER